MILQIKSDNIQYGQSQPTHVQSSKLDRQSATISGKQVFNDLLSTHQTDTWEEQIISVSFKLLSTIHAWHLNMEKYAISVEKTLNRN